MAVPALSPVPTKIAPLPDAASADARVSPGAAEAFRSALETAGALPAVQADAAQVAPPTAAGKPVVGTEAVLPDGAIAAVSPVPAPGPASDEASAASVAGMPQVAPEDAVPSPAAAGTMPKSNENLPDRPAQHTALQSPPAEAVLVPASVVLSAAEAAPTGAPATPGTKPVRHKTTGAADASISDSADSAGRVPASMAPAPTMMLAGPLAAQPVPVATGTAASLEQAPLSAYPHAGIEHGAAVVAASAPEAPAADASAPAPEPRVSAPLFSQTLEATTARHTALPYAASPTPAPEASVTLREGRFGTDVGVAIARALDGGPDGMRDALLIRLDPRHMGRVDVRMSFEDDGTLRAVVSADSPAALDMLRRESTHLDRALSDAGVRADAQSLRFDGSGGGTGQHRQGGRPQGQMPQGGQTDFTGAQDGADPTFRSLRGSGHVDLMA